MKRVRLPEECIELLEDKREIKNLMGKYAVFLHLGKYNEIFEELWCRSEEKVALGFNEGHYKGRYAIKTYYQSVYDKIAMSSCLLRAAILEQFEEKKEEAIYGMGHLEFKPVQMPVIHIDEERKWANIYWYSQGNMTEIISAGPTAFWTWGSFRVKCMWENDEWRIYTLDYFEDIKVPVGQNWCRPVELELKQEFAALDCIHIPKPNEPAKLYERFSANRPWTKIPEPEATDFLDIDKSQLGQEDSYQLQLVIDRDEIEQIMGMRTIYTINEEREKEISELWVNTPEYEATACFGRTWGFYVGMGQVYEYYVTMHKNRIRKFPLGSASAHPLRSPSIQISKDGKTAKGLWYSLGHITTGGKEALWVGRKVAADFVKENDRWKIWHLCEIHDAALEPGEDFSNQKPSPGPGEDPLEEEFGIPAIAVKTHERLFCWTDDFPWMPEPYVTMLPNLEYSEKGFFARQRVGTKYEQTFVNITENI